MYFKYQNFSNSGGGLPFSMAVKPLVSLGIVLVIMGLLITAYPDVFAGLVAFLLYFIAALCLFGAWQIWRTGRKFQKYANQAGFGADNSSENVQVDVKVID